MVVALSPEFRYAYAHPPTHAYSGNQQKLALATTSCPKAPSKAYSTSASHMLPATTIQVRAACMFTRLCPAQWVVSPGIASQQSSSYAHKLG